MKLELHPDKSKVIPLSQGIDFVGFRNFYYFKLLRKRNINNMKRKADLFNRREISEERFVDIFQGWNAYAKWANSYKLRSEIIKRINLLKRYESLYLNRYF